MITSGNRQRGAGPVVTHAGRWVAQVDAQRWETKAVCASGWPRPWPYMAKVSAAWSRPSGRFTTSDNIIDHSLQMNQHKRIYYFHVTK